MLFAASAVRQHVHHRLIPAWLIHFGAAGVFGMALFDAAPVPTPIPAAPDILIIVLGIHGDWPWLLALSGVAGSVLGGYLTWAAGKKGGEAMLDRYMKKRPRLRAQMTGWIRGHGLRTVAIAGLLPPPLPTLPVLLGAGALGVTRRQLLIALSISRSLRYGAEAALAVVYGRRILHWANRYLSGWSSVILYSFLGLIAMGVLYSVWQYRRDQRASATNPHSGAHATR